MGPGRAGGLDVFSLDRWHDRCNEQRQTVDVPVEGGSSPTGRPAISLWVGAPSWGADDDEGRTRFPADEHALVVARLAAARELLGRVPAIERGAW